MTILTEMPTSCKLIRADQVKAGDTVRFNLPSSDYTVEEVEGTQFGNVRHRAKNNTTVCSYHPGELLWVESANFKRVPLLDILKETREFTLLGAERACNSSELKIYDDTFGRLFVYCDSMGVVGVVRAQTFSDAYGIVEDEFLPEADESIDYFVEEYGENWPESSGFTEAYGFRPNGPSQKDTHRHGIYSKDVNGDYLYEVGPEKQDSWVQEVFKDIVFLVEFEDEED